MKGKREQDESGPKDITPADSVRAAHEKQEHELLAAVESSSSSKLTKFNLFYFFAVGLVIVSRVFTSDLFLWLAIGQFWLIIGLPLVLIAYGIRRKESLWAAVVYDLCVIVLTVFGILVLWAAIAAKWPPW